MTEQLPEQYVAIGEVAKYFSVSASTVRVWIHKGAIPRGAYLKVGDTYRFKISVVDNALTNWAASAEDTSLPSDDQLELFPAEETFSTKIQGERNV